MGFPVVSCGQVNVIRVFQVAVMFVPYGHGCRIVLSWGYIVWFFGLFFLVSVRYDRHACHVKWIIRLSWGSVKPLGCSSRVARRLGYMLLHVALRT